MTKLSKFNNKIYERAAYLPDRIRDHIVTALEPVVESAEIAQCAYDNAVSGGLTAGGSGQAAAASSDRITELLRTEAIRANDHFEEILNIACILASEINADIESETHMDVTIPKPTSALNIRDITPHQYKLRDLIKAELEIPVIGKIIARSNVIAVCELIEGCYLYNSAGLPITLIKKDTKFLGIVDDAGKIEPIIPYDMDYTECYKQIVDKDGVIIPELIGHFQTPYWAPSTIYTPKAPSTIYTPKAGNNIGYCLKNSELSSEGITGLDSSEVGYFVKQVTEWVKERTVHWSTQPILKPKFRVIRYEQSYKILVAAPWDFGLDSLKTRALGGERLDVRYEIEKVLLGHQTPSVVNGAGVGFTHVLESQLQMFSIKNIMS